MPLARVENDLIRGSQCQSFTRRSVRGAHDLARLADGGFTDWGIGTHQGPLRLMQPAGHSRVALDLYDDRPLAVELVDISGSRPGATAATACRSEGSVRLGWGSTSHPDPAPVRRRTQRRR